MVRDAALVQRRVVAAEPAAQVLPRSPLLVRVTAVRRDTPRPPRVLENPTRGPLCRGVGGGVVGTPVWHRPGSSA